MLKFGLNMVVNQCVMCANFGDPRSRDRELRRKKTLRNAIFGFYLFSKFYLSNVSG